MFIRVPRDSTKLSTGKCAKLAPCFCGPFTIVKHIDSSAYHLHLLASIQVHLVFHVCFLKELLGSNDNFVSIKTLVTFEDLRDLGGSQSIDAQPTFVLS